MDIDEYINRGDYLRQRVQSVQLMMDKAENRAVGVRSSANYSNIVTSSGRRSNNTREEKLADYADIMRDFRTLHKEYKDHKNNMRNACYNLKYWQGLLIDQLQYNRRHSHDDFFGMDAILNTQNSSTINKRLDESKKQLADKLRGLGVEIES